MELTEGNRSSMEESSLIGMRLHLEVQCQGQAAEVAGWSSGRMARRRCQHFMSGRCTRAGHAIELPE